MGTEEEEGTEGTVAGEEGAGNATAEATQQAAAPKGTARGTATGAALNGAAAAVTPPAPKTPAGAAWDGKTLNERLARERAAADKKWATELGFSTVAEAKAFVEKAKQRENEDKEKKLAEMDELERTKALLAEREQEIANTKAELERTSNSVLVERQDRMIGNVAAEYVKPKALPYASFAFKAHLKTLTDEQVERMKDRDMRKFFENFVKENPELAPTVAEPAKPAPKVLPARRPITTGAPPPKVAAKAPPAAANGANAANGKTVLPGHKNSMSPAEVRAFAQQHGIEYPGPGQSARSNARAR